MFGVGTFGQETFAAQPPLSGVTVSELAWRYHLSEPQRRKIGLAPHLHPPTAIDADLPLKAASAYGWRQWYSTPVRSLPGLSGFLQHSYTYDTTLFLDRTSAYAWRIPHSEPVRQRPGLGAHLQALEFHDPDLSQVGVASLGWRESLSEPSVKVSPSLGAFLQKWHKFTYVTIDTTQLFAWARYLAEPVRFLQVPTALQQFATHDADVGQIGVASLGWRGSLSEPSVKTVPGVAASRQQFHTAYYVTLDLTQFNAWARHLAEPVRYRQFSTALQQFVVQNADIANTGLSRLGWRQSLTEPVRTRQIPVAEIPFATQGTDWASVATSFYSWGRSWAEPIRMAAPVMRVHVPVLLSFPKLTVSVTMNLIEFNQDTAGFSIFTSVPAKDARISIIEVSS